MEWKGTFYSPSSSQSYESSIILSNEFNSLDRMVFESNVWIFVLFHCLSLFDTVLKIELHMFNSINYYDATNIIIVIEEFNMSNSTKNPLFFCSVELSLYDSIIILSNELIIG